MGQLGYAGHAELVNSSRFLPQRRLRAWCVFFHTGHASIMPSLAFSLCCPTEQAASLDSVLDEQDKSQPLAWARMKPLQPKQLSLKWPRRTATFIRHAKLSAAVLNSCATKLQYQGSFARLTARQQRLLVARFAWMWQKRRLLVLTCDQI